ncbi:MAG: glycosyltransferase [Fibrobacteria bacterium]|nr:glycosyltransferase [Fibrobacteria bacterium]
MIPESDPLVSVEILTFQHAGFIRETLEGILAQKTGFPFEIILHDDASTDGTSDIVREFQGKYPNVLFPIIQTENQWSKGVNISATFNSPRMRGKYVAVCEGDDVWIDPLKLSKQVEILEKHSKIGLVHTGFSTNLEPDADYLKYHQGLASRKKDGNVFASLLCDNFVSTPTVMLRREAQDQADQALANIRFKNPIDKWYWLEIAARWEFGYIPDPTVLYRVHEGGMSKNLDFMLSRELLIFNDHFRRNFRSQHLRSASEEVQRSICSQALQQLYARQVPWLWRLAVIPHLKKLPVATLASVLAKKFQKLIPLADQNS